MLGWGRGFCPSPPSHAKPHKSGRNLLELAFVCRDLDLDILHHLFPSNHLFPIMHRIRSWWDPPVKCLQASCCPLKVPALIKSPWRTSWGQQDLVPIQLPYKYSKGDSHRGVLRSGHVQTHETKSAQTHVDKPMLRVTARRWVLIEAQLLSHQTSKASWLVPLRQCQCPRPRTRRLFTRSTTNIWWRFLLFSVDQSKGIISPMSSFCRCLSCKAVPRTRAMDSPHIQNGMEPVEAGPLFQH